MPTRARTPRGGAPRIGREPGPGAFGENLTLAGVDVSGARIGAIAKAGVLEAGDAVEIVHRPAHDVTVALVIQTLLIERERVAELEPARADMLPKLAAWYEERQAA
jgi:MOSC domain-containing protein YiiM